MKVIITGGLGFLGLQLCTSILARKVLRFGPASNLVPVTEIVLVDVVPPDDSLPAVIRDSSIVRCFTANIGGKRGLAAARVLIDHLDIAVFHMAAIMSGEGERDPDKCFQVNFEGTRNLLNAIRYRTNLSSYSKMGLVRFVFPSAGACFGPASYVSDTTKFLPQNTYGTTKAMAEMLIIDYNRRGWIDGRIARLPSVIVRPGKSNVATTSIFSAVVREPLSGQDCVIPISLDLMHPVTSYRTLTQGLLVLHDVSPKKMKSILGHDCAVNMPAINVSLRKLYNHTRRVAAKLGVPQKCPLGSVVEKIDPEVNRIVSGMAQSFDSSRAQAIGCPLNPNVSQIITDYWEDFGLAQLGMISTSTTPTKQLNKKDPAVGFIGIGFMGSGMAMNLAKAGFRVVLYNRSPNKAQILYDEMKKRGKSKLVSIASSVHSLCNQCDVVLTCLATEEAGEDLFFGSKGLFRCVSLCPGTLVIDHATVSPSFTRRCHDEAKRQGIDFLDAPISGGPEGASNGTLAVMVGGSSQVFYRAFSILNAMGNNVQLMGDAGSGTATKLVNQLLCSVHALASCEAMALCKSLGLTNYKAVLELLANAWGNSRLLQRCGSLITAAEESPNNTRKELSQSGAPLRNMLKDCNIIQKAAKSRNLFMPAAHQTQLAFETAVKDGLGAADMSILYCLLQEHKLGGQNSKL